MTTPGLPAVVRISRRKIGGAWAFLGVLGGVALGWSSGWPLALVWLGIMLPLAALFYSGVSRDSNVRIDRGLVFAYPRKIGNETTALTSSTCKPRAIKEEGDAVLVLGGWSELRIVFQNESVRSAFVSEVSGLVG